MDPTTAEQTIGKSYPKAEPFKDTLIGSPAEVAKNFHWADHLIDPGNIIRKYEHFAAAAKIPLDGSQLSDICFKSFDFCGTVYNDILFPKGSPQLPYHDLNHGLITSITAQKIFLGGLISESEAKKFSLPSKEKLASLHHLFSLVSSFHEIDDWWDLPYPNTEGKHNPNIEKAKSSIAQHLEKLGLSSHDFNRLLALDDFREKQEVSLKKSLDLKRGEGFLPEDETPSLLDQFTLEERKTILKVASGALCASDFLQIINPAYLQPVKLILDKEKRSFDGLAGPYALAWEMQQWRRNALEPAKFGLPDGTVFWKDVNLSSGFFQNLALPRINSGLKYLNSFSPTEYKRANLVLDDIKLSLGIF